jgi:hypothetical protein
MTSDRQKSALYLFRLGQLFAHLGFMGEGHFGQSLGYIEDDDMMGVLVHHLKELQARAEAHGELHENSNGTLSAVDLGSVKQLV